MVLLDDNFPTPQHNDSHKDCVSHFWYSLLVPEWAVQTLFLENMYVGIDLSDQWGISLLETWGGLPSGICQKYLKINVLATAAWDKQQINPKAWKMKSLQLEIVRTRTLKCSIIHWGIWKTFHVQSWTNT